MRGMMMRQLTEILAYIDSKLLVDEVQTMCLIARLFTAMAVTKLSRPVCFTHFLSTRASIPPHQVFGPAPVLQS